MMGETKRALLVVAGGRPIPDILALFHVQPHIVVYLKSKQKWEHEDSFVSAVKSMDINEHIKCIPNVDAYDPKAAKIACEQALQEFPDVEWTFTMSAGPKISSISAYEFARQKGIPCLFVDTSHKRIILLDKDAVTEAPNLICPDVEKYMSFYHRTYQIPHKDYRPIAESWVTIAREMALSSDTHSLLAAWREAKRALSDRSSDMNLTIPQTIARLPLLQAIANKYQLVQLTSIDNSQVMCSFASAYAQKFLITGDWLEIYAWDEARQTNVFDDCQWGYKTIGGKAENELDLAATYNAQLIIGECKSGTANYVFDRHHLDTLDSIAHLLGGHYVTKLLITDQSQPSEAVKEQADKRRIRVITKEELPQLKEILKQEAEKPTYSRI